MKKILLMITFIIVSIIDISADEKQAIIRNNWKFNSDYRCLYSKSDIKSMQNDGMSYYQNFDSVKYKNKTIGYIITDLSKEYKLIYKNIYYGFERLRPKDLENKTHFTFKFKMNDSMMLEIHGCLDAARDFYEKNDSIAMETTLSQDIFLMDFIEVDIAKYYQALFNDRKNEFYEYYRSKNYNYDLIEEHFPEIVKRIIEENK